MGQRVDKTWEGNRVSDRLGTFWEFHDPVLSIPGLLHFPCFRGGDYEMELGPPPYPPRVAPSWKSTCSRRWLNSAWRSVMP